LLIFFLMTAQITAPPPFDMDLPDAQAQEDGAAPTLYISGAGELAFETLRGAAALAAASRQTSLTLQADAGLDAGTLAGVLADLSRQGVADIRLMTQGGS
jgi:biopolymer transport protein ExbD